MRPIDAYFFNKMEPARECLLFLRGHIGNYDENITEEWKYSMPFYYYRGKMLCYLWTNKKTGEPYIGIVDGDKIDRPELIKEKRNRMKILLINPLEEIPIVLINDILSTILSLREK